MRLPFSPTKNHEPGLLLQLLATIDGVGSEDGAYLRSLLQWRIQRGAKGHAPPPKKTDDRLKKSCKSIAVVVTQCFDVGND